jgi:chromosomal replication initiation ATPase DnaA
MARNIAREVGPALGVSVAEIMAPGRSKTIAAARRKCYLIARKRFHWSYHEIGNAFGRNHSTIVAACAAAFRKRKLSAMRRRYQRSKKGRT